MGIPDRESWLLREYYPTGTARGWRRTACLGAMLAALVLGILVIVISIVVALL